jgi:putative hemolysin
MANQSRRPRDLAGPSGQGDVRAGNLEVRLAATVQEVDAAQALRYRVFYDEMGAKPSPEALVSRRDRDRFDEYCDHLLVIDHGRGSGSEAIVGTYRLLRRSIAERQGGFYTATEFDITPLLAVEGELLELGRSCVEAAYRTRPTMQLLWRGIGEYCFRHDIKLMFGCASLPGTDTRRARALPERYVAMDLLRLAEVDTEAAVAQIVKRATVSALPPLIKGYLRLGALIGEGAVIDHEFGTTDVCIIVVTDRITDKYFNHYIRGR